MPVTSEIFQLQSRHVFIDTSVYFLHNFQFLDKDLGRLIEFLERGQITLLCTSITASEVRDQLANLAREASGFVSSFQKKAKILRNLPQFSASAVFAKYDATLVEEHLLSGFERFLSAPNICFVDLNLAAPEAVFEQYFRCQPPFSEAKKNEFKDAFVLAALEEYAVREGVRIHVVSADGDMRDFCAASSKLIWSENLGDVLSALLRSDREEPAAFADKAYQAVESEVIEIVTNFLSMQQFGSLDKDGYTTRHLETDIKNLCGSQPRLLAAERSSARMGVTFTVVVEEHYFQAKVVDPEAPGTNVEIMECRDQYLKSLEVVLNLEFYEGDTGSVYIDDYDIALVDGDVLWEDELVQPHVDPSAALAHDT